MIQIDNLDIYALVVGIETYKFPGLSPLSGPATEAVTFASWLRDREVPSDNIHLFVSFSQTKTSQELTDIITLIGLKNQKPTFKSIEECINNNFLQRNLTGELLYVFWGGHGILTFDNNQRAYNRRLYLSDSNTDNFFNLNWTLLERTFANTDFQTGFNQQIFIVDACATFDDYDDSQYSGNQMRLTNTYNPQGSNNSHDQFIFYGSFINGSSRGRLANILLKNILPSATNLINNIDKFVQFCDSNSSRLLNGLNYKKIVTPLFHIENLMPLSQNTNNFIADRRDIVQYFLNMIENSTQTLFIQGSQGYGKTFLKDYILKQYSDSINSTLFASVDVQIASEGMCSILGELVAQLQGAPNFPILIEYIRSIIPERYQGFLDTYIITPLMLDDILNSCPDQNRQIYLRDFQHCFLQDLTQINQRVVIFIDSYNMDFEIEQVRDFVARFLVPTVPVLAKDDLFVVILGQNCFSLMNINNPHLIDLNDNQYQITSDDWIQYFQEIGKEAIAISIQTICEIANGNPGLIVEQVDLLERLNDTAQI